MKRAVFVGLYLLVLIAAGFAQTSNAQCTVTVEITNIVVGGGKIYLAIFGSAEEFRRETPSAHYEYPDTRTSASLDITLPAGEYLMVAFQDANGNQTLDRNILGVPREIMGMTNYNGRGLPARDFNRHKITVNGSTGRISIGLFRI